MENRKLILWKTAIALQAVDGLKTSDKILQVAKQNLKEKISVQEAVLQTQKNFEMTDVVAARMFEILSQTVEAFELAPTQLIKIHKNLFAGFLESAGEYRKRNIAKKEWALDGEALYYPDSKDIANSLKTIFEKENEFDFEKLNSNSNIANHIANFISEIWQIHPFEKFNTQTIAIFFLQYLFYRKFAISDALAKNPVYFRNALTRAVFCDTKKNIFPKTEYFEKFIANLLFDEKNKLNHKMLHINFDEEGVAIKEDIANRKVAINSNIANENIDIANTEFAISPNIANRKKRMSVHKKRKGAQKEIIKKIIVVKTVSDVQSKKHSNQPSKKNQNSVQKKDLYIPKNEQVAKICKKAKIECNEKKEKILLYLLQNKSATNLQAREAAKISTETARKILLEFSEKGIVQAQGSYKKRIYLLNKKASNNRDNEK